MTTVQLPPGNRSLRLYDGTRYVAAREGGHVTIDNPDHAKAINAMQGNGDAGLLNASDAVYGAVRGKAGRVCTRCRFVAYAWATDCPRCGSATEPEQR